MTATMTEAPARRRMFDLSGFVEAWARLSARVHAHVDRTRSARSIEVQLATLPDEAPADLGMSAEDILGVRRQQDALPFFMQAGFGKRG